MAAPAAPAITYRVWLSSDQTAMLPSAVSLLFDMTSARVWFLITIVETAPFTAPAAAPAAAPALTTAVRYVSSLFARITMFRPLLKDAPAPT